MADNTSADEVVILIAHGSRSQTANDNHHMLCGSLGEQAHANVVPAFLELAEPSIGEAIDAAAATADSVRLLPLFVHSGNHVTGDIPEIVEEARVRNPQTKVILSDYVGADPAFFNLLTEWISGR